MNFGTRGEKRGEGIYSKGAYLAGYYGNWMGIAPEHTSSCSMYK